MCMYINNTRRALRAQAACGGAAAAADGTAAAAAVVQHGAALAAAHAVSEYPVSTSGSADPGSTPGVLAEYPGAAADVQHGAAHAVGARRRARCGTQNGRRAWDSTGVSAVLRGTPKSTSRRTRTGFLVALERDL